jgi:hypothetical protein
MVPALLVLAVEEAEPSKAAFYVCGGLLVAWAFVLFGMGMARADFPGTAVVARGVIALTTVLVIAAMATAVITG